MLQFDIIMVFWTEWLLFAPSVCICFLISEEIHLNHSKTGQRSMLEGSIWKGIASFAVPIFFGNLFQQLYNTADTLIVGNFIGKEALAAVSSSGNLIFMIIGLLNGMAMGAGVIIAKFYGAKDNKSLSIAVHTDLAFGFIAGVVLTVFGVIMTPHILRWMGTPENVLPNSIAYFRTYFFGVTAVFIYNVATGILQAVGDSRHPLYYLIISSIINVVLDLLFVGVMGMGVVSAAAATVISQAVSAILCLRRLIRSNDVYKVTPRKIRINGTMLRSIVRFGLPSGIQNSLIGFANVMVQTNINAFGSDAMAGCGSYSKVEGFAFLPITCFAMALSTFVSQNLGAKQYDRVRQGTRFGIITSVVLAELVGVIIWTLAPFLISLFNSDPDVCAYGIRQARTIALFYCLLAASHCFAGIFRGAGRAFVPMLIMMVCWCIIRVTFITIAVPYFNSIGVVFFAYPLTWTLSTVTFIIYFFTADWIHTFDRLEAKEHT